MIERKFTIKAPIEYCFQAVRDFEAYPDFLKTTKSAKEQKKKASIEVDFTINVIKEISYTLRFEEKPPYELRWVFVSGDLIKSNTGAWLFKSMSDTQTEATYQIDISFGWLVPKMIVDQITQTQLPETLEAFRKRAEKLCKADEKKGQKKHESKKRLG